MLHPVEGGLRNLNERLWTLRDSVTYVRTNDPPADDNDVTLFHLIH